jgi:hypothetical protein
MDHRSGRWRYLALIAFFAVVGVTASLWVLNWQHQLGAAHRR